MTPKIQQWKPFGTSIFSTMSQLAARHNAINLAQGFPDFDGPQPIKAAAIEAIRSGNNQYAPSVGLLPLRQKLSKRFYKKTGLQFSAEKETTVFSGATEAIFCACQALFQQGDEILTLAPFYDSYPAAAFSCGASLVGVPLQPPNWTFTADQLKKHMSPKTKGLLINTPHNPSGRVLDENELGILRDLAVENDLYVITDEVYDELVFAPSQHLSLATLPDMKQRTVTISSTSKTFSMTGWKIGYAFAPESLSQALRTVHQFTVFCSATPLQSGMVAALELADSYYGEFRQEYRLRRDALVEIVQNAGFTCDAPQGTYFVLAGYGSLTNLGDVEFANWLTREIGVAAIPISVFYSTSSTGQAAQDERLQYVRLGFCKDMTTLEKAGERLQTISKRI